MFNMGKPKQWTDEELKEWIKSFTTKRDLRSDNYSKYTMCLRRGLHELFPTTHAGRKWSDDDLIEWIKSFNTIADMRSDNTSKYFSCCRRGLHEHFPSKRTKSGNIVGTNKLDKEQQKVLKAQLKEEKRLLKEDKQKKKEEKKEEKKANVDSSTASKMYSGKKLENGNIICGRCLEESNRPSRHNTYMCHTCYNKYMNKRTAGLEHNKWNIRDEFCHTQIKHHEKVFTIGLKVDERTQNYLTMIGYGFIFKEPYDE